jgi:hypothetical protein
MINQAADLQDAQDLTLVERLAAEFEAHDHAVGCAREALIASPCSVATVTLAEHTTAQGNALRDRLTSPLADTPKANAWRKSRYGPACSGMATPYTQSNHNMPVECPKPGLLGFGPAGNTGGGYASTRIACEFVTPGRARCLHTYAGLAREESAGTATRMALLMKAL